MIGAVAWLLTRAGTAYLHSQARRASDPRMRARPDGRARFGRIWLLAGAIVLARYVGGKDDGLTAAVLVLAAFTVYLAMSFVTRDGPIATGSTATGRPSPS